MYKYKIKIQIKLIILSHNNKSHNNLKKTHTETSS